jgi:hypothetical protein
VVKRARLTVEVDDKSASRKPIATLRPVDVRICRDTRSAYGG